MVFGRLLGFMMGCLGLADSPTQPSIAESTTQTASTDSSKVSNASPRIRLSDGRYLAYRERGVPKNKSNYRVIVVHGFGSSKEMHFLVPQDVMDELGIYLLLFDRAGYGDSDPNPKRSLKSEASDIQELADQLISGSKFFVIGVSVGSYPTWSCLKRIPHRQVKSHFKLIQFFAFQLAGVALVVPFINYRWPSLPRHLIDNDYRKNLSRWALLISRYAPALLHWYMTQKLFPSSSVLDRNPKFFSKKDMEVLKNSPGYQLLSRNKLKDRALFDSHRRDFIAAFGKWDFDPLCLSNPFPDNKSLVHIWQGCEDKVVPVQIQRFVSEKLPWIHYHEVPDGGHFLVYDSAVCEAILRSLVLGEDPPLYRPNESASILNGYPYRCIREPIIERALVRLDKLARNWSAD
ncbi:hypothetical protein RJ640_006291 [Escallonia rubra]|uniref:AB hydrolase-1 domain-containing protein n=1 Tax=Escallonia rubra TaxID=112253 RepID=A0AA88R7V2_9ASTE|nr:hypothetical protein RJ640_006291 [Escallonia rubra]